MASLEREVQDAEDRLQAAMLTNDVDALGALLHDDLEFVGPDGTIVHKMDDLSAHAMRRLRLTALTIEDSSIEIDGTLAFVAVRAILTGTFDGNRCDGSYRYTRTWRRTGSHWQVIAGRVSPERAR